MTRKKQLGESEIKFTFSGYPRERIIGNNCMTKKTLNSMNFTCSKRFVPSKVRTKLPGHCTEKEKELHGNSTIDRVKNEIIILENRASEFKTQHEEIDNNVLQKIESESKDSDVLTALKQLRIEDYETEEEKCLAILVQRLKGGDYHLSGEFTGPTFSSSLFGVDFESGC